MNYKISQVSAFQLFQLIRFSTLVLIGVVFSKTGLAIFEIGQYETFLFLAGAVSFFWLNGVIQAFLPVADQNPASGKSPVLFNVFYLLILFAALAVLFVFLFEKTISEHLLHGNEIPFRNYLMIYLLLSSPASLVEYVYLIKKQGRPMLVYGGVSFFMMFLLVVLPPVLGYGIEYSMAGLVISSALRLVWLLVLLFRHSSLHPDFSFILTHLKHASPLVLSMFLSGSAQYIDGFIITSYFEDATFAVFRFGAREFPLVLLLANAFSASMLPGFANPSNLKANLEQIRQKSQQLGSWLFPLSGLLMLVSHWAFPVVFNASFAESSTIFNIYLLLIVSRLLFPQTILIGLQKNRLILSVSFLEIVVNVTLSLWFVQFWGIAGVAFGTVCAYIFEKVVLMVLVRKTCGFRISEYLNVKQQLLYSLLLAALFIVVEFIIF